MSGLTIRERLIEAACHAQEQAREADRAAGDVTRLLKAPAEYLELEA